MLFVTKLNSRNTQKCNGFWVPLSSVNQPLLAKQYFPRQRRPAFTDWETRGHLCFLSWLRDDYASFTSRIQVHGKEPRSICKVQRDWWEGVWGKVICYEKVQQSFLKVWTPSPTPHNKKFLDPPLLATLQFVGQTMSVLFLTFNYLWFNHFEKCIGVFTSISLPFTPVHTLPPSYNITHCFSGELGTLSFRDPIF